MRRGVIVLRIRGVAVFMIRGHGGEQGICVQRFHKGLDGRTGIDKG